VKTFALSLSALVLAACSSPPSSGMAGGACCGGDAKPAALKPGAKNVGIVIFDEVFITEFAAPFDVYKHTGDKMNVFTVSPKAGAIRTYEGVVVHPDYCFANVPKIDILVVPSGMGSLTTDLQNAEYVAWVKKTAAAAEYATSHCWGCFTLAATGMLDGKECTTFPTSVDDLQKKFPAVKAQKDQRYVVAGKFVTSNGGLAAFEAALYVVEKVLGREAADKVASGLVYAPDNRKFAMSPR
jgi:transcriptional regulator GlxA family with amidase domain